MRVTLGKDLPPPTSDYGFDCISRSATKFTCRSGFLLSIKSPTCSTSFVQLTILLGRPPLKQGILLKLTYVTFYITYFDMNAFAFAMLLKIRATVFPKKSLLSVGCHSIHLLSLGPTLLASPSDTKI